MFSNINIKKIVLWLVLIMTVSFLIAGSILVVEGFDKTIISHSGSTMQKDINVEKTFDISEIKDIDIDTVSTDINIIPVDSDEVRVHFYGTVTSNKMNSIPELSAELKGSKLDIGVKRKVKVTIGINIQNNNLKLDIYMPAKYSEGIVVDTTSANLTISGFNLDNLNFRSVSGDFIGSSVYTKQTSFITTSGNVESEDFVGDLYFESVSGNLDVEYSTFNNNIKIDTTSGSSKINLPEGSEFNLYFKSVSGNYRSDFPLTTTGRTKNKIEGSVGSSDNKITITSISGDAQILK